MCQCIVYVGCLCVDITFYGPCRCIVSFKTWVWVGSYVHVHTHATYHAVMKVAEDYGNVWKLCIFCLVWVNLNYHTVQVAWRYRTTVGLLQSVCMCCYHTIGVGSLFRVQLDTRMWFLQVENAFLGITQTLKDVHTFWTWIYIAVTDWNDPS